jgi:hypothetical protein
MSVVAAAIAMVFVGILIAVITMFTNIIRSLICQRDWWEIPVPVGLLIAVVSMLAALALTLIGALASVE